MTERQQNVAPRAKRAAPKTAPRTAPSRAVPSRSASHRRRGLATIKHWILPVLGLVGIAMLLAGYFAAAGSDLFALKRVEVVGATRTEGDAVERAVRSVAGGRLLDVDLDEVR